MTDPHVTWFIPGWFCTLILIFTHIRTCFTFIGFTPVSLTSSLQVFHILIPENVLPHNLLIVLNLTNCNHPGIPIHEIDIVTCISVIIDGFWIVDHIYWTLWYSAWLHFIIHYYTHSHVFTSRCSVAASNDGRSLSSGFQNCPWPQLSASNSNSSQQLSPISHLINSLTHQPTSLNLLNPHLSCL
jgi:hypothetical protein